MQTLTKGANAALTADRVRVEVVCSSPVDVSALLLDAAGRVRGDADMVFYNQPDGPGVRHRPAGGGTPDTVLLDLSGVPARVERVAVTASLDGSGPATFGAVGSLRTRVLGEDGSALVEFAVDGMTTEKALVCVEVYRRAGAWKVRAVGQGYSDGLAGLATEFGISVDDAPAPAPPAAATPPAGPIDVRRPRPVAPPPPAVPAGSPVDMRRPGRTPAQPAAPQPTRSRPAPVSRGQAPAAAYPPPTGRPARFAPPTPTGASVPATTRVNLDKGRVSLRKQQSVSLVKTGSPALRLVRMGLGWDPAKRGADVDLDASVIAFDAEGRDLEKVWYGNLRAFGDAVLHSGDNLTGEGEGDDEVITLQLDRLPGEVAGLVFTVNSFTGQTFVELKTAYCRLLDDRGSELVRFDLADAQATTGVLMAMLVREPDGTWSMTALGEFHDGRNVKRMVDPARTALLRR